MRQKLIGELIGLARATEGNDYLLSDTTARVTIEALIASMPDSGCDLDVLRDLLDRIDEEKRRLVPMCYLCQSSCGRNNGYDLRDLESLPEKIRLLKTRILRGACAAARASDGVQPQLLYRALYAIGARDWEEEELLPIAEELEKSKI